MARRLRTLRRENASKRVYFRGTVQETVIETMSEMIPNQGVCPTPWANTPYWMHVRRTPGVPFQAEQVEEHTVGAETVTIRTKIYRDAAGRMRFEWDPYAVLLSASPEEQQADPMHRFTTLIAPMRVAFRIAGMGAQVYIPKGQLLREEKAEGLDFPVLAEYENPRHTIRIENIQRGEPDPSLFQVPSDYTVYSEPAHIEKLATMKFNTTDSGA
jgi:hypothetical protein